MKAEVFLIIVAVQLLDPFKVVPLLAVSYYAKSRVGAVFLGVLICAVVTLLTAAFLHTSGNTIGVYLLAAVIVGALVPAILWGPMSRWNARNKAAKAASPPTPSA